MAKYGFGIERTIPLGGFASVKVRVWAEFDDMDIEFDDDSPYTDILLDEGRDAAKMRWVRDFVKRELDKAMADLDIQTEKPVPRRALPETG
jgi:hypothetical protein